ncbi:dihydrolipoamide acetyltransferase family protein [Novosphingobium resinovorum]|uniref:Dihydrolipoamide acetyltransferase component of pyruvate dehydrogenase complex n=1 Tax=Novosphingobium resinovorum TaxID=158500 RepID=A0A031K1S0_9SPHN|nr:dihydrolipoamide acetyltransferase family protein [Novosphingobium resinovorum]AOR78861.1 pyruvate dehydrogenase complex dihydrolipoamide acetyltransferase [Novosphingobium resinovorum]EZP82968.1 Dihydrolipoyllysine-residue acetyltransferase [Novosphingobium resinovorum]
MAIELKMPALSPTMEKGTLARWLVGAGDTVKAGDLIAEIETDKATMEMEAAEDGRIARLVVPAGSVDVPVGAVVALLSAGEDTDPVPLAAAETYAEPVQTLPVSAPDVSSTSLARRLATARGIGLDTIAGSGPRGRIMAADLGLATAASVALIPAEDRPLPAPQGIPMRSESLSTMRRTIARRLTESKQTVPHFYLTARCRLDGLLELRRELNGAVSHRGARVSVNDFCIKAISWALEQVPEANVQFAGDRIHRFERVDIAMAVAIEGGLVTPVIRDVAALSLGAASEASRSLAAKAREGRLTPGDYEGGTATISNLGMFGIDEMVPVINPPQAMILGIGAGVEQPWKIDGDIALATIMAATGSFDHRAIDGALAAQFMAAFREAIEAPMLLIA